MCTFLGVGGGVFVWGGIALVADLPAAVGRLPGSYQMLIPSFISNEGASGGGEKFGLRCMPAN